MVLFKHSTLTGFARLILGDHHSMILRKDGSVWSTAIAFRDDASSRHMRQRFAKVIPSSATAAAAGAGYGLALKQDGSLWAMGRNNRGQLGDGTRLKKTTFAFVKMVPEAKAVAGGGGHSMILTQQGGVWITGWNKHGQLGDASTASYRMRFVQVIANGAIALAAVMPTASC